MSRSKQKPLTGDSRAVPVDSGNGAKNRKYRTTRVERNLRAATVTAYLRRHGPADSEVIAAGTGMDQRAVIGALTGLRRAGEARPVKGTRITGRFVWLLCERLNPPKPKPVGKGIATDDLEWMEYWKNHSARRAVTRRVV